MEDGRWKSSRAAEQQSSRVAEQQNNRVEKKEKSTHCHKRIAFRAKAHTLYFL